MPGERHATLKLRLLNPTAILFTIDIWLNGQYERFNLGPPSASGEDFARAVAGYITARLASGGHTGTYSVQALPVAGYPQFGLLVITATSYLSAFDFHVTTGNGAGWTELERLPGIKPVYVESVVQMAQCFGANTGSITLRVNNGTPEPTGPYTYLWSDGVTTRDRPFLAAGSYNVIVSDVTGAFRVTTIIVGQNPELLVTLNRVGSDIIPTVAGGVGPYTYAWADGPTTPGRPNVVGGVTYAVTVTDSRGCSKTSSLRFELLRYWFSGNPIPLRLDAGDAYRLDPSTKPGLRFGCEVFVEPDYLSGTFVPVGPAIVQPADSQGRTTFEVQEVLEPYVDHHLPELNQARITRADGLFRRFYLRHYEITRTGISPAVSLDDNYLVRGGLGFVEAGTGTWFSGYQDAQLPFFTHEPLTKKVFVDQPEYLYCMVPRATTTELRVQVRVTYDDASTSEYTHATVPGVQRFELYCLPVGFGQLQLELVETSARVVTWEVFVLDQLGAAASEHREYVADRTVPPAKRYFLYANSLGGTNTLCARGRSLQQLASKTLSGERVIAAGYDPLAGDVRTDRRTGVATLKVSAGVRSAAQALADADFLLSERVLWQDGDRYRAGTAQDRTLVTLDEEGTRRTLEFEFELPRDRFFTPRLR